MQIGELLEVVQVSLSEPVAVQDDIAIDESGQPSPVESADGGVPLLVLMNHVSLTDDAVNRTVR